MSGVPKKLAKHKLHIDLGARPVKQTLRPVSEEYRRTIAKEVNLMWALPFGYLT
jgi:hypothetical protein